MSTAGSKNEARHYYRSRRNQLTAGELAGYSSRICDSIRNLCEYKNAECVAGFSAFGAEPDLSSLFPEKRFFLPRYREEEKMYEMVEIRDFRTGLVTGRYGIAEPHPELEAADPAWCRENLLYLVPAVACDRSGIRTGRGAGFYDRLLAGCVMPKIGVIFSCQLAEALAYDEHDIRLDMVVTENECVVCKTAGTPAAEN